MCQVRSSASRVRKKRNNILLTTEQQILIVWLYCGTNCLKRVKDVFKTDFPNNIMLTMERWISIARVYCGTNSSGHTTLHSTRQHDLKKHNLLHLFAGVHSIHLYKIDMFALFQVCVAGCVVVHLRYFAPPCTFLSHLFYQISNYVKGQYRWYHARRANVPKRDFSGEHFKVFWVFCSVLLSHLYEVT